MEQPLYHELLARIPPAFPLSSAHPCTSRAHTWEYGRHAKKACTSRISRVLGVCFTDGIWRAGALPLRGQQEFLVKEVSRKLFSSEQASDGREAHRGRQSTPELCSRYLLHLPLRETVV